MLATVIIDQNYEKAGAVEQPFFRFPLNIAADGRQDAVEGRNASITGRRASSRLVIDWK